jgi:hypothetical protein
MPSTVTAPGPERPVVARQTGHASTSPNSLNRIALPSITGRAASGPMSPSPSTAVPSVTTATAFFLIVKVPGSFWIVGDRAADARNARRVRHREIVARLEWDPGGDLQLPTSVEQQRAVGDVLDLDSVQRAHSLRDARDVRLVDREDRDVAHLLAMLEPDEADRI